MTNDTQINKVKHQLLTYGNITRNWALQRGISRLGAIIAALKDKGWEFFDGEYEETANIWGCTSQDYIYRLKKAQNVA